MDDAEREADEAGKLDEYYQTRRMLQYRMYEQYEISSL